MTHKRPVYLNLLKIKLPLMGMVSLVHRITGILLFLSLPFAVYLLDLSVESQQSFEQARQILAQPLILLVLILVIWSLSHHFFAGIRFLLIDAEIGVDKPQSQIGAWLVIVAEVITLIAIVFGVLL